MKCQNCGINYYDDDKECPMCGTKAGHKGRLSAPRYTGYHHKEGAEPCSHQTYTKKAAAARPKVSPMQQEASDRTSTTLNGRTVKRKSGKASGWVAVLVIIVLSLTSALAEHIDDMGKAISDAIHTYNYSQGYDPDYSQGDGYDDFYEGLVNYAMLEGQWRIDREAGGTVLLDVDDSDNYTLQVASPEGWIYTESGFLTLWEDKQADVTYDDRYPPETYACYILYLTAERADMGSEAVPDGLKQHLENGYMALFVYHENGASEDSYIIYDYVEENAPIFPGEPETMVRVQGA